MGIFAKLFGGGGGGKVGNFLLTKGLPGAVAGIGAIKAIKGVRGARAAKPAPRKPAPVKKLPGKVVATVPRAMLPVTLPPKKTTYTIFGKEYDKGAVVLGGAAGLTLLIGGSIALSRSHARA